jgi:hypothetical protein
LPDGTELRIDVTNAADMPDPDGDGGQASWHARRGGIFVSCDHLRFGDATLPPAGVLDYDIAARVNAASVEHDRAAGPAPRVRRCCGARLQRDPHRRAESAGRPPIRWRWVLRGSDQLAPRPLNAAALAVTEKGDGTVAAAHPFTWAFHWDDEPAEVVTLAIAAASGELDGSLPSWRSTSTPAFGL